MVVADGKGDEIKNNIHILDVGKPSSSRFVRFFSTTKKIYRKALEINAHIYHFHDPELIPYGIKLSKEGKKVLYDVHEDVPRQILNKPYFSKFFARIVSKCFELYENYSIRYFNAIVCATPYICNRFVKLNRNSIDVSNFPIPEESPVVAEHNSKAGNLCYIGNITLNRGIMQTIQALKVIKSDVSFNLAGLPDRDAKKIIDEAMTSEISEKICFHGFVGREEIYEILSKSHIGLVLLSPIPNYIDSLPVKMFEYFLAGIPVIASDFPLFKSIVEENNCGICINPHDASQLANAVDRLIQDPETRKTMGNNGRQLVLNKLNWNNEKIKLLNIYNVISENSNA